MLIARETCNSLFYAMKLDASCKHHMNSGMKNYHKRKPTIHQSDKFTQQNAGNTYLCGAWIVSMSANYIAVLYDAWNKLRKIPTRTKTFKQKRMRSHRHILVAIADNTPGTIYLSGVWICWICGLMLIAFCQMPVLEDYKHSSIVGSKARAILCEQTRCYEYGDTSKKCNPAKSMCVPGNKHYFVLLMCKLCIWCLLLFVVFVDVLRLCACIIQPFKVHTSTNARKPRVSMYCPCMYW